MMPMTTTMTMTAAMMTMRAGVPAMASGVPPAFALHSTTGVATLPDRKDLPHMTMPGTHIGSLVAAVLVASFLGACGGTDTSTPNPQGAPATEAEATSEEVVVEEPAEEPREEPTEAAGKQVTQPQDAITDPHRDGEEHEEMLELGNVRLSVKEAGTGPDMVLIHGRTLSKETIDPLFDYYKDRYHVVSYDVRGHGQTESYGEFTLDDLSDDLMALIDAYQLEDPVVIGFSMGSYIALRTAERHPGLLSQIVLIGTRGGRTSSPWPSDDEVGRALESYDNMTDAPSVTIPVLVLTGEFDAINPPEEGQAVADALPNATYLVVPGAEHMAYAGNPDFVFEQIDAFLG